MGVVAVRAWNLASGRVGPAAVAVYSGQVHMKL